MKYLSILLLALVTLVSCNAAGDAEDSTGDAEDSTGKRTKNSAGEAEKTDENEDLEVSTLGACECVSEATALIKTMDSVEEMELFEDMLFEAYPECVSIDDVDVEKNCAEEMEEMMSVMMSKSMELGGM